MLELPKLTGNNKKDDVVCNVIITDADQYVRVGDACGKKKYRTLQLNYSWRENRSKNVLEDGPPYTKVYANSPCPLFAQTRRVILKSHDPPSVVRICQAPIDDSVDTPYLKYAELAKRLGAWQSVKPRCAFCSCCKCCGCGSRDYELNEHRDNDRRRDMRAFDMRVKHNYQEMRIMYDHY